MKRRQFFKFTGLVSVLPLFGIGFKNTNETFKPNVRVEYLDESKEYVNMTVSKLHDSIALNREPILENRCRCKMIMYKSRNGA